MDRSAAVRQASAEIIEWEGIAADIGGETGCDDPPVDAFELAEQCELKVEPGNVATAQLDHERRIIKLNVHMRRERQHMSVAHEVGHFALIRAGVHNDCPGARHIGGALMMPWRSMDRDLRRTWSIEELRAKHVNVSATALAVRVTQLRDAVVTILDPRGRRRHWRSPSPWLVDDPRLRRVTTWERELARLAYEERREVRGADADLCYAVPLIDDDDPREHRVLVLCELDQLSLRLKP